MSQAIASGSNSSVASQFNPSRDQSHVNDKNHVNHDSEEENQGVDKKSGSALVDKQNAAKPNERAEQILSFSFGHNSNEDFEPNATSDASNVEHLFKPDDFEGASFSLRKSREKNANLSEHNNEFETSSDFGSFDEAAPASENVHLKYIKAHEIRLLKLFIGLILVW